MGKKVKEFVTYWGPSINDWGDGTEQRFVIERDEELLKKGVESGARRMDKIALNDIFKEGVVTGVDMVNGFMPLVLYANDDIIIEVANCDHRHQFRPIPGIVKIDEALASRLFNNGLFTDRQTLGQKGVAKDKVKLRNAGPVGDAVACALFAKDNSALLLDFIRW